MIAAATGADYKSAPPDNDAFFRLYYGYIVNLVLKHGIEEKNKEDCAAEIIARLIEKRAIETFDPDLVFEYEGQQRPARFKTYISRYVCKVVRGMRDQQKRLAGHEVQICDMQIADDAHSSTFTSGSWADVYGPTTPDHADDVIEMLGEEQDAGWMRTWLSTRPKRFSHDRCDLVELFDAMRAQVLACGTYNIAELEQQFGMSTTAMHNWMWWLRGNVAAAYNREAPAKRARTLSPQAKAKLAKKKEQARQQDDA